MLFYKPIVSFVACLAAVSGVAASATPMARQGSWPPPTQSKVPASTCASNGGTLECCNTMTSTSNPDVAPLVLLTSLVATLNSALSVGLSCLSLTGNACSANAVCCNNVSQCDRLRCPHSSRLANLTDIQTASSTLTASRSTSPCERRRTRSQGTFVGFETKQGRIE
ncbi:hypothetical protein BGW80DRAFT_574825 [Lactifluus volemus]|nr:hypothetical protein BGW80DRAFT_574825 [Lactifluus volemus]